ncbi:MAG: UbiA family prenyltransferase, partial [Cytophagales bacterium]|nr:UbiA family prenyltransferase [Cytophagales bacterium]
YAFFMTLVREIVKDIEDMKGDAAFGCRTLPIEIGLRPTKRLLYIFIIVLLGSYLSLSLYFELYSTAYLVYSVSMLLMILRLAYQIFSADTKKEFTHLSNYSKMIMIFGVLGIAFI